jgi:hypothetical protein
LEAGVPCRRWRRGTGLPAAGFRGQWCGSSEFFFIKKTFEPV